MAKLPLGKIEKLVKGAIGVILDRRDQAIAATVRELAGRVEFLERRIQHLESVIPTQDAGAAPAPVVDPQQGT